MREHSLAASIDRSRASVFRLTSSAACEQPDRTVFPSNSILLPVINRVTAFSPLAVRHLSSSSEQQENTALILLVTSSPFPQLPPRKPTLPAVRGFRFSLPVYRETTRATLSRTRSGKKAKFRRWLCNDRLTRREQKAYPGPDPALQTANCIK